MTYQTSANVLAAVHRETSINTQATATGATQIRIIDSQGVKLNRAQVQSAEKLATGLKSMGRLGYKSVDGSIDSEISVGGATDMFLEAIMRSTAVATFDIGFATMTTVAIGTNALTAAGGDWAGAQGVRVGDVFYLSSTTVSGNNGTNHIVTAVTSLTITTVTGAFTTLAATATGTLSILKKMTSPTGAYSRFSHTIEQNDSDIDSSELFTGCRVVGVKLSFQPGQMAKMTTTFLGVDRSTVTGASAPYFTSPTLTTSLGLVADDSTIRYNGAPVAKFTGFDLDFTINAKGEPTIGSLTTVDIFDNDLSMSGTITSLRSDFSNLSLFDAETEFEVSIVLQEPTGSPPACLALYIPRAKISALSAPLGGGDGAKKETLTLMIGPKTADASHNYGYCSISSSGA